MSAPRIGLLLMVCTAGCGRVATGPGALATTARAATLVNQESVMAADALRTGWYSNQPLLDPTTVSSPYFGQLFDTALDGAIYAQPLFANGVLFVATETNHVYALDPATGAPLWTRRLATPWLAADLNCGDLQPDIGVTGTPAIDVGSGTAYLFSKTYANGVSGAAMWLVHALDLTTGTERDGFPVNIAGKASNEPSVTFNPTHQAQRPGLLLMNGVVYAAFGAHCDQLPYAGWVIGISTRGVVTTMWTTESGPNRADGGGIWQAGGGLVSDGDGQILFATGNDWASPATPIPGHSPPGTLGESIVRLSVQADGSLMATDFFAPSERAALNQNDIDLGSGAPVGLPAGFGTDAHPNLLAQAGKSGSFYLLDRDDLGGYKQAADGGDQVLQRIGPYGGVWSKPAVWPGDGGYVYEPVVNGCASADDPAGCLHAYQYGVSGDGAPMLSLAATSTSSFGYGSSAVVVTSDGTRSGSALLWTVWSSGWDGSASQLRAYDAVPTGGALALRYLAGIGTAAKFTAPSVGDNRLYVGTRDGHVVGFGVTGAPPVRADGLAFPPTLVGDTVVSAVQVTASGAVNVAALGVSGDFSLTAGAPTTPFAAKTGAAFALPVAFHPTTEGPLSGTLQLTTDAGTFVIPLTGVGQSPVPRLALSPTVVTFAPLVIGDTAVETITITNVSDGPMTLSDLAAPAAPFGMSGLPALGTTLPAGGSVTATITFSPTTLGSASGYFSVSAGDALAAVAIAGSALGGGHLRLTPEALDLESMPIGDAVTAVFQLVNDGDAPVVVEKSKPPTSSAFVPQSPLDEGTIIAPGVSLEQLMRVSPTVVGANTDVWQLNADDGQGLRVLTMTVTGVARPVAAPATPPPVTSADAGTGATGTTVTSEDNESPTGPPATVVGSCGIAGGRALPSWAHVGLLLAALAWRRRSTRERARRRSEPD